MIRLVRALRIWKVGKPRASGDDPFNEEHGTQVIG